MNVSIKVIPHNDQAYETPGDWRFTENGDLNIFVSELGDWRQEMLIAIHELIEVCLCKQRGIAQADVDEFDIQFEKDRRNGIHGPNDEPGDDPAAPYRKEHFFATNLEALISAELGVDWNQYEKAVYALEQKK